MRVVVPEGTWLIEPPPSGWPGATAEERLVWIKTHLRHAFNDPHALVGAMRDANLRVQLVDHGEATPAAAALASLSAHESHQSHE